ncbi:MAG: hypothetical protein QN163_06590 [Armatimonadota bacterium]|nr:hypothetical protein [Armatimonadota bacterium]MDR5697172.1 hypothetical protein [Armatimonadota bacterium]
MVDRNGVGPWLGVWAVALGVALAAPGQAAEAPAGHESSSGVLVAGGGAILVVAVWVTPGLVDHPYYVARVPSAAERDRHRALAGGHTVMSFELSNRSRLLVEGPVVVNLFVDEEIHRVVEGSAAANVVLRTDQTFERIYVFPKLPAGARSVVLLVQAPQLTERGRWIGYLPQFRLGFDLRRLTFPP